MNIVSEIFFSVPTFLNQHSYVNCSIILTDFSSLKRHLLDTAILVYILIS